MHYNYHYSISIMLIGTIIRRWDAFQSAPQPF